MWPFQRVIVTRHRAMSRSVRSRVVIDGVETVDEIVVQPSDGPEGVERALVESKSRAMATIAAAMGNDDAKDRDDDDARGDEDDAEGSD